MGTTARPLTEAERKELAPLLAELNAHVESCAACKEKAKSVEVAADFGEAWMCDAGAVLYRRWLKWLAGT